MKYAFTITGRRENARVSGISRVPDYTTPVSRYDGENSYHKLVFDTEADAKIAKEREELRLDFMMAYTYEEATEEAKENYRLLRKVFTPGAIYYMTGRRSIQGYGALASLHLLTVKTDEILREIPAGTPSGKPL